MRRTSEECGLMPGLDQLLADLTAGKVVDIDLPREEEKQKIQQMLDGIRGELRMIEAKASAEMAGADVRVISIDDATGEEWNRAARNAGWAAGHPASAGVEDGIDVGPDGAEAEVKTPLTWVEIYDIVSSVVKAIFPFYGKYVEFEDISQDIWLYRLGAGKKTIDRYAAAGNGKAIAATFRSVARRYCEIEKAARSGYEYRDVAWYTPSQVEDLLPLALDPGWDAIDAAAGDGGDKAEYGTLLAMVMDVRRAISAGWVSAQGISKFLGGEKPVRSRDRDGD